MATVITVERMTNVGGEPRLDKWFGLLAEATKAPDEIVCVELKYSDESTCWVGKKELETNASPGCYVVSNRRKVQS
jgi:hypothetical protein